jgi:DNA-binding transcriptional LysR family regulator
MRDGDAPWVDWLADFVEELHREELVDEFVRAVDAGILADLPSIADDPVLAQDLHTSTRSQWLAFLAHAIGPDYRFDLPGPAADLARSLARRGKDLGVLLKVYRTAHRMVFQYVSDATVDVRGGAPARDEVLVYIWRRAGRWMDDSVERLIEIFYQERRLLDEGALVRRTEVVEDVLAGRAVDVDAASRTLGHSLRHWQVGLVVWAPEAGEGTGDALAAGAAAAARALGAPPPLTLLAGSRDLWAWLALPEQPDLSRLRAEGAHGLDRVVGVHVAVGTPARGAAGFAGSHQEARATHQLAVNAVRVPPVLPYADVELLCLATARPELLHRMVLREIGPLCGGDKNLAQVRSTALAFLVTRNVEAAAERLFVHKNTVRYRLSRAEELLGRPLTERAAKVEVALRYVAMFGPPPVTP